MLNYYETFMKFYTTKVTSEFISYRNSRVRKFNPNGRNMETRLQNADCEFAEFYLTKPYTCSQHTSANKPQYDTIHPTLGRCEWKCVTKDTATMKEWCLKQDFDTFIFWRFVDKPRDILEEGDEVTIEFISTMSKEDVLKKAESSYYNTNDKFIRTGNM